MASPAEAAKFNGTVVVEWTNVSEGFDNEVEWFHSGEHFVRSGYAWVGVSAQNVGVTALKQRMGERYSSLDVTDNGTVTGDGLSYDIFTAACKFCDLPAATERCIVGMRRQVQVHFASLYLATGSPSVNVLPLPG